jgi:hypothetical protein
LWCGDPLRAVQLGKAAQALAEREQPFVAPPRVQHEIPQADRVPRGVQLDALDLPVRLDQAAEPPPPLFIVDEDEARELARPLRRRPLAGQRPTPRRGPGLRRGLQRGAVDVLGTLLHEAAHGLADARSVKDTSRQGRYHNLKYAHLATELGLDVTCDPTTGWSQTTIPDQLAAVYADVLADLAAALVLWRYAEQQRPTSTSSRNLLACACPCGRKLRVARQTLEQAPIVCGACEHPSRPV